VILPLLLLGLFSSPEPPAREPGRTVVMTVTSATPGVTIGAPSLEIVLEAGGKGADFTARYPLENAGDAPLSATLETVAVAKPVRLELQRGAAAAQALRPERDDAPAPPAPGVALDPLSNETYLPPQMNQPAERGRRMRVEVALGPRERATLLVRVSAPPGIDRVLHRRTLFEASHYLRKRYDPLTYQWTVLIPEGPFSLKVPDGQSGAVRRHGDAVLVASTEHPHDWLGMPLGLSMGAGFYLSKSGIDPRLRLALDAELPGGLAVLSFDADPTGPLSAALAYRLQTRFQPFLPIGAHLEVGGVLDVYPRRLAGVRAGLGSHFFFFDSMVQVDLFPGEPDLAYRVAFVTTFSL